MSWLECARRVVLQTDCRSHDDGRNFLLLFTKHSPKITCVGMMISLVLQYHRFIPSYFTLFQNNEQKDETTSLDVGEDDGTTTAQPQEYDVGDDRRRDTDTLQVSVIVVTLFLP